MTAKINLLCAAVVIVVTYSHCIVEAGAYCSLEKMKQFAVEACEHLFQNDEPSSIRQKREYHHKSKTNEIGFHNKNHVYAVRRSSFPHGGYLKVAPAHFEHLTQLNIFPMYKAHYNKKKHHDGDRHKRSAYSSYAGLPYCCYNKCDEDFFCR